MQNRVRIYSDSCLFVALWAKQVTESIGFYFDAHQPPSSHFKILSFSALTSSFSGFLISTMSLLAV